MFSPPLAIGLSSLLFQNRPYCEWNTLWYWVSFVSIISRNGKFQMESSHTRLHDPLRKRRFSKNAVQTQGLWKPRVCVLMWTKRFWKRSFSKRDDEIRIKMEFPCTGFPRTQIQTDRIIVAFSNSTSSVAKCGQKTFDAFSEWDLRFQIPTTLCGRTYII